MKLNILNIWIFLASASLTSAVVAQDAAPASTGAPAAESTPAAPKGKGSAIKKKVVLDPPGSAVVKTANVNVRGQASFNGETVGHLQKGDAVTVLEQITLRHPTKDEPADWDQIALPAGISVWIDGDLIDKETKTVKAKKVNLRGGPGENYSVLGRLEKGAPVKEVKSEKGWVAVEAPTNAYAYVAAEFLEMQTSALVAPPPVAPAPTPTPTPAPTTPEVVSVNTPAATAVAATSEPTATTPLPAPAPVVAPAPAPTSTPAPSETEQELAALHAATAAEAAPVAGSPTPAPAPVPGEPRVVTREGFVRRTFSIQAPTDYELRDIQSGTLTEYLLPKAGQNFKIFVGTRVSVTGPEAMDNRWPRTPVLTVESVNLMP